MFSCAAAAAHDLFASGGMTREPRSREQRNTEVSPMRVRLLMGSRGCRRTHEATGGFRVTSPPQISA